MNIPNEKVIKSVDVEKLGTSPEFEALKQKALLSNATNEDIYSYAIALQEGRGTKPNLEEAAKLFNKLYQQQYAPGIVKYALCLLGGKGIGQNTDEAIKLLKDTADKGFPDAQFAYACILQSGQGISIDLQCE